MKFLCVCHEFPYVVQLLPEFPNTYMNAHCPFLEQIVETEVIPLTTTYMNDHCPVLEQIVETEVIPLPNTYMNCHEFPYVVQLLPEFLVSGELKYNR
jgi:hypothetical protein